MNYPQTLNYLYTKLPMFSRIGDMAYKVDITNTKLLCESLGHPENQFKSIHIAGTNGKGSCSHMLASVFQNSGYRTGLYTSPHLIDFRERIKINGQEISEDWVIDFVEKIKPAVEKWQPSFFEVTVAMAFAYFAEQNVDIAIIETGLGGLLDSTNVITPILSIITNISYDHTNLLGKKLSDIAYQKAGIIKQNIPVVIGETHSETDFLFQNRACELNSECVFADQQYRAERYSVNKGILNIDILNLKTNLETNYKLDLIGIYQLKNSITVLTAIDTLKQMGWSLSEKQIKEGLETVKLTTGLKGRFDILHTRPTLIVDVAHNEAGLKEVLQQVETFTYKHLHIVLGFVSDKDVDQVLSLFNPNAHYYFTQADIPRALPWHDLLEKGKAHHLYGQGFKSVKDTLDAVMLKAGEQDLILVTGSFFILADVYSYFEK